MVCVFYELRFRLLLSTIFIKQLLNFSTCLSSCWASALSRTLFAINLSEYVFIFVSRSFRFARDRREASLFRLRSSRYFPDSYSIVSSSSVRRRFLDENELEVDEQEMLRFLAGRVSNFFFVPFVLKLLKLKCRSAARLLISALISVSLSSSCFTTKGLSGEEVVLARFPGETPS